MPLIVTSVLRYVDIMLPEKLPEEVSRVFLTVPKKYLYATYEIKYMTIIWAETLNIEPTFAVPTRRGTGTEFEELRKEMVGTVQKFFYIPLLLGDYDRLHLGDETWEHLRDYGITPDDYRMSVKITYVETEKGRIAIFPRRDIFSEL